MRKVLASLAMLAVLSGPGEAGAQIEIEADPIAYGLNGYSFHVAGVLGSTRLSIGTFGADVPEWVHGNDGWSSAVRGAGIKLDYLGSRMDGLFVGVEGGYMRMSYGLDGRSPEKRTEIGAGVRGGYRLDVGGSGLYVVPWMGVGYNFGGGDIVIGEERFEYGPITIFPTVHIGWRF